VQATEKIEADLLLRLASNRCVWGTPDTYKGRGAPRKHGHKFKFNDPETWPEATETLEVEDPKVGKDPRLFVRLIILCELKIYVKWAMPTL